MMTSSRRIVMTAAEVAKYLGGVVNGNAEIQLEGFAPLHVAREGELSFLHLAKYRVAALDSKAGAIIVARGVELGQHTLIVVSDPTEAYRLAIELFHPPEPIRPGVSSRAIVDESVVLG